MPNIMRVRTVFTGVAGSPWYSNLFYEDGGVSTDAQAAAANVRNMWNVLRNSLVAGVSIHVEPFVPVLTDAGVITGGYTVTPGADVATQVTGNPVPPSNQLLLTFATGVYAGGRELKGKTFVPRLSLGNVTAFGGVDPAAAEYIRGQFAGLLTTGPDLVVWSRKNAQHAAVSSVGASTKWAVLRSRRD